MEIYKLICIDLDGTLLNSKKCISKENESAINYAIEKGVKVVICSGRIYSGAKTFATQLNLKGPIITCNGALIKDIDSGEVIYNNYLDKVDCQKIIDMCHEYNIYFHAYIGDTLYTEKLEYSSLFYWKKNKKLPLTEKVDIRLVKDIKEIIRDTHQPVLKLVVISENNKLLLECRKRVSDISSVTVTSSDIKNFEIMNLGVSKGNAVKIIGDKFNIIKEETIAIGDNENDLQMFEYAGLKVAMGNAENCVKDKADFITLSSDENGVAKAIHKYIE